MSPLDLVEWTDGYLNRKAHLDSPEEAEVLVFGSIRRWKALLPAIRNQGSALIQGLLLGRPGQLESLSNLPDHHFVQRFRERILSRLGYPKCLSRSPRVKVTSAQHLMDVMAWLGSGRSVLGYELEFEGFQASSTSWGALKSPNLVLKNGEAPANILWQSDLTDPANWHLPSTLRIERVSGLRNLTGFSHGHVVLKHCCDLESIDGPCSDLQVENCPKLSKAMLGIHTKRIVLRHCTGLRAIESLEEDHTGTARLREAWSSLLEQVEIQNCFQLRALPPRLNVKGGLLLHEVGPIESWPWDFQVGETFLISDCPMLESLPPVEVQGSLIVTGNSGLRRLSPGTVVAKHLDLRACIHLEDIPRGVKVGGTMFLPEHLNHRRQAHACLPVEGPTLFEVPKPDLYEDLRDMLKSMRFADLIPCRDRLDASEKAAEILGNLQARLAVEPRLESLLLWTASEVWRELSEDDWAGRSPWASDGNESDEDLPMAWFLGLVRE